MILVWGIEDIYYGEKEIEIIEKRKGNVLLVF